MHTFQYHLMVENVISILRPEYIYTQHGIYNLSTTQAIPLVKIQFHVLHIARASTTGTFFIPYHQKEVKKKTALTKTS